MTEPAWTELPVVGPFQLDGTSRVAKSLVAALVARLAPAGLEVRDVDGPKTLAIDLDTLTWPADAARAAGNARINAHLTALLRQVRAALVAPVEVHLRALSTPEAYLPVAGSP